MPLTPKGLRQSTAIAQRFERPPVLIVTSPYLRTAQTARQTIERFPDTARTEWPVHEYTYLAPARCYQTTLAERQPMVEEYWQRSDPHYVDGEGAESFAQLVDRAWQLKERFQQCADPAFLAIFSHAQFMRAVIWALFYRQSQEQCLAQMKKFRLFCNAIDILNGAIVEWQCKPNGEIWMSPVLTAHLASGV